MRTPSLLLRTTQVLVPLPATGLSLEIYCIFSSFLLLTLFQMSPFSPPLPPPPSLHSLPSGHLHSVSVSMGYVYKFFVTSSCFAPLILPQQRAFKKCKEEDKEIAFSKISILPNEKLCRTFNLNRSERWT